MLWAIEPLQKPMSWGAVEMVLPINRLQPAVVDLEAAGVGCWWLPK